MKIVKCCLSVKKQNISRSQHLIIKTIEVSVKNHPSKRATKGDNIMTDQPSYQNKKLFAISLIILQLIIIPLYAVFLRVQPHNDTQSIGYNYPSYMDLIVMITIGMGYLNTFIGSYMYMGMIHNWLYYVVSIQIYFLFAAMWKRVILAKELFDRDGTGGTEWGIQIREQDYTLAAYSCTVMNMVFGIVFGRVGFFEKLVIVVFEMVAYTLNAIILNDLLKVYDVGGSIFCHTFGAYFGMGISFVISRAHRPITKINHSYDTIIFSYIGCFLIFCFAPSINSQYLTETPFEKSIVIMNTILSMCGSVLASFAMSVWIKGKFSVIDLFNGSLSGCIGAGSSTGLFVNPCACMILGAISGIVCVLGMEYLTGWLERNWKIFDTFGIHNVRGLPGIIGGLGGAVGIALSYTIPQEALQQLHYLSNHEDRTIGQMVGFQVLGTFSTVIFALLTGMFTGWVITFFYNIESKYFYMDNLYFELPQGTVQTFNKKRAHIKKKESFMDKDFLEFTSTPGQKSQQNSGIPIPGKLPPLKKTNTRKMTIKEKFEQTIQKLPYPLVKEQDEEHSQFQQEMKRKRSQLEREKQDISKNGRQNEIKPNKNQPNQMVDDRVETTFQ